jgi:hypothetical protein
MKTIYHQFRNVMHVVGFLTLAYKGLGLTDLDLPTWQKIVLGLVLSAIGYGLAHAYEGVRYMLFGDPVSKSDGNLSWIGFTIGAFLILFVPNIGFINTYLFYFCLTLFVLDNGYAILKKYKIKINIDYFLNKRKK